ncbi:hypothetical protein K474DRAFT_1669908 [Panus rudis PR-1116 ss-1]|nr:hypothetical protein K474DRAFT_1669908 [Panus rudis PR-1116 ss-1]
MRIDDHSPSPKSFTQDFTQRLVNACPSLRYYSISYGYSDDASDLSYFVVKKTFPVLESFFEIISTPEGRLACSLAVATDSYDFDSS